MVWLNQGMAWKRGRQSAVDGKKELQMLSLGIRRELSQSQRGKRADERLVIF